MGVVTGTSEEDLSDWDEEENEARPRPLPLSLDSAHIPAVIGASREPSAVQSERVGGGEGVGGGESVGGGEGISTEVPEATVERSKVATEMEMEVEDKSILSLGSESDLPMFGGYTPTVATPSHQPPIRQGLTPPLTTPPIQRKITPTLTPTSPTVITPLSITAGIYPVHVYTMYMYTV